MTLSTIIFAFGFLPIFLLIYYICKDKIRDYVLLAGSVYFYYVTETFRVRYILLLCISVYVLTWVMNMVKQRHRILHKILAFSGIAGTVLLLFYYRYLNFSLGLVGAVLDLPVQQKSIEGVPLGLSFMTFSIISYIADCYNGKVLFQKNPVKLVNYILMFPKVIMGPIERYADLAGDIEHPEVTFDNAGMGIKRFMIGFCKKVIIADNLAVMVNQIQTGDSFTNVPVMVLWLGSIGFSLQLYFDFAGYSEMAIGIAQMLGYKFKENFNYPYCANSITDFWRRWHISLSYWFRDYVYIPLGGSRRSLFRNVLNLFIVWLLTGLWHGASFAFILWGLVYFIFLLIERYVIRPDQRRGVIRLIWRIVTLLVINFDWVIFHIPSWRAGIGYCKAMVGLGGNLFINDLFYRYIREYSLYLILGVVLSTPFISKAAGKIEAHDKYGITAIIYPVAVCAVFIWALSFSMLGVHNPFIYQQF